MSTYDKKRTIRTLVMTALAVAALACMTIFLTASAAATVSPSDAERTALEDSANVKKYFFKPKAEYNGSYRSELSEYEKLFYDAFYQFAFSEDKPNTITLDVSSIHCPYSEFDILNDISRSADYAFWYDYPEFCWFSYYMYNADYSSDFVDTLIIGFDADYDEREVLKRGISSAVDSIRANRASNSRYDTVKAIHDYICDHATYGYNEHGRAGVAAPVFGGSGGCNEVVCEGYACAFKLLCNQFDIPALVVSSHTHAWNLVQMEDGKWYEMDCTWDDGDGDYPTSYNHFLQGTEYYDLYDAYYDNGDGDHVLWGYLSSNIEYPFVYPEISKTAYEYVPKGGVTFWGDCAKEDHILFGNEKIVFKYKGKLPTDALVDVFYKGFGSSEFTSYGSYPVGSDGLVAVDFDATRFDARGLEIKAVCNGFEVQKHFRVNDMFYEILNWRGDSPILSGSYRLQFKGCPTVDVSHCRVDLSVDGSSIGSFEFKEDGTADYTLDTNAMSNGSHKLRLDFSSTWGSFHTAEKSFRVYNGVDDWLFWENSAQEGRVVGDLAEFTVKYNGAITSGCRLNAYIDGKQAPTFVPNHENVMDAFDDDGLCAFYLDVSKTTVGSHAVRVDFIRSNGEVLSISNHITVTDGYFSFENNEWFHFSQSAYGVVNITYHVLPEGCGSNSNLYFYLDNNFRNGYSIETYQNDSDFMRMETTGYPDGEHILKGSLTTSDGLTVEKNRLLRINNRLTFQTEFPDGSDGLVGELVEIPLKYNGRVTNRCQLNAYLDDERADLYFPGDKSITKAFSEYGYGTVYIDASGKPDGEHIVRIELREDDGTIQKAQKVIRVSNGFLVFWDWQEDEWGTDRIRFKNLSGEPIDWDYFIVYIDGCSYGGEMDEADPLYYDCGVYTYDLSHGNHFCKAEYQNHSGVKVTKIRRFRIDNPPPDFSFNTLGASIRLSEPYGIRFGIQLDKNDAFKNTEIVEYGTLIIASGTLGDQELTYYTDKVRRIKAVNLLEEDSNHIIYTGVLINIPTSFFDTNIKGRGYLIYKDKNGYCHTVYSQTVEKSFNGVARAAYDSYSRIQNPTDAQKEALRKLKALLNIQ